MNTIRQLSELLDVDLLSAARESQELDPEAFAQEEDAAPEEARDALTPEQDALADDEQEETDPKPQAAPNEGARAASDEAAAPALRAEAAKARERRVRRWWVLAGAAVLICVAIALLPRLLRPADARDGGKRFRAEDYLRQTPNDPGKAYLAFDNRVWVEQNGGTSYQMYEIAFHEENGIGFLVSRVDIELEGKRGFTRSMTLDTQAMRLAEMEADMPPYGSNKVIGGFPEGEFLRIGVVVYGTDRNGEALSFYSLTEF